MTQTVAAILWFVGLVGWYIIRHPFARKAKRTQVTASYYDHRESFLLAFASLGLFVIPAVYVLTGFPRPLDRPFVPVIAWFGLLAHCAAFFLLGLAQMLLLPNWLAGGSGLVGAGALYAFRIKREEQMMLELFGEEYRAYMKDTKRLIPWLL